MALVVMPDPFQEMGGGTEELHRDPTVGPGSKVWTRGQNGSSAKDGAPKRRDNPEGDELDPAKGVRRRCKKNSPSVLSCIG